MNINSGVNLKSIPLQNLPPEAFTVVVGDGAIVQGGVIDRYETIPWLYRGVEARCNALGGVPFAIHKGDIKGPEVAVETLSFKTNIPDLLNAIYRDYILTAQWYVWVGTNDANYVKELRRFIPSSITPQYNTMSGIEYFKRKLKEETVKIPVDEMIYLMRPSSRSEVGAGVSDAKVALAAAGVIGNLDNYAAAHFNNGALNPTLISTQGQVQEVDRARFKSWMKRIFGRGAKNAFTAEVVEGDFKVTTLGYPIKDLMAKELNDSKREDIATALGVPQTLLFSNAANYATALQDDLHFYDKTIRPDGTRFEHVFNEKLFHPLGLHFAFHWERMEIYQLQKSQQVQALVSFVSADILDKNEVREELGYEPRQAAAPAAVTTDSNESQPPTDSAAIEPVVKSHTHVRDETPLVTDLTRWQKVAVSRLREGKPAKALEFESAAIRPSLMASIKGALETVKNAADVKHIFADAIEWAAYP